jgi:hypothetical protein
VKNREDGGIDTPLLGSFRGKKKTERKKKKKRQKGENKEKQRGEN